MTGRATDTGKRYATFFLSTGRSGTQWVARTLQRVYGDLARVEHEPLGAAYQSNRFFRQYDCIDELEQVPAVRAHLAKVQARLEDKHYIEAGWPCYGALPLLCERMPGQVRIVHLVRHPVATAVSLLSRGYYRRHARLDPYARWCELRPEHPGFLQLLEGDGWEGCSHLEKRLSLWGQISGYAGGLHRRFPDVPWLTVRMEDLFDPDSSDLPRLLEFAGLPLREDVLTARDDRVDQYRRHLSQEVDAASLARHRRIAEIASRFGYAMEEVRPSQLRRRFVRARAEVVAAASPKKLQARCTVVIPCYQAADTLPRAAESVLSQSMKDFCLVIVDDGSTDGTLEVARRLAAENDAVAVLSLDHNSGRSAARNAGARHTRSPYLAFLDADDFYDKHFLRVTSEVLDRIAAVEAARVRSNIPVEAHPVQKRAAAASLITTLLIRRTAFEVIGGIPESHVFDENPHGGEDIAFWERFRMLFDVANVDATLHNYTWRPDNCLNRFLQRTEVRDGKLVFLHGIEFDRRIREEIKRLRQQFRRKLKEACLRAVKT